MQVVAIGYERDPASGDSPSRDVEPGARRPLRPVPARSDGGDEGCGAHAWAHRPAPPCRARRWHDRAAPPLGLLYIGQDSFCAQLAAHAQKPGIPGHPQAAVFAGPIECSCVLDDAWHTNHRLELENDLIAARVLTTGTVPPGQCIG